MSHDEKTLEYLQELSNPYGTKIRIETVSYTHLDVYKRQFLQYEEDPRVLYAPGNSVRHITINSANPDQPILGNEKFRQALFYGTDRQTIAKMVKEDPADYIVPTTHIIDLAKGTKFRDTEEGKANTHENYGYDEEKEMCIRDSSRRHERTVRIPGICSF